MGSLVHVLRTEDSIVPVDKELELQEAIIYRGLGAFEEMGNALIVIRDQRLYRSEFPNFEIYTQNRLELSRRYVDFLINAASIMAELRNENFSSLPTRETHVRPLSRLSREERINVWNSVIERVKDNGKVTASLIKEVVEEEKKKSQDDNSQAPKSCFQKNIRPLQSLLFV